MNETPAQPATPPADRLSDTAPHGPEATGNQPASATVARAAPASASGTEVTPSLVGYAVLAKIGEGGMGSVYLAEDARFLPSQPAASAFTCAPEPRPHQTGAIKVRGAQVGAAAERKTFAPQQPA